MSLKKEKRKKKINNVLRFSGMAVQMGVTIAAGTFAGQKLDAYFKTKNPYFTIGLALFSVVVALYLAIKPFLGSKS